MYSIKCNSQLRRAPLPILVTPCITGGPMVVGTCTLGSDGLTSVEPQPRHLTRFVTLGTPLTLYVP